MIYLDTNKNILVYHFHDGRTVEIPGNLDKVMAVVKAARAVIDQLNPMFIRSDNCISGLMKALKELDGEA